MAMVFNLSMEIYMLGNSSIISLKTSMEFLYGKIMIFIMEVLWMGWNMEKENGNQDKNSILVIGNIISLKEMDI